MQRIRCPRAWPSAAALGPALRGQKGLETGLLCRHPVGLSPPLVLTAAVPSPYLDAQGVVEFIPLRAAQRWREARLAGNGRPGSSPAAIGYSARATGLRPARESASLTDGPTGCEAPQPIAQLRSRVWPRMRSRR